MNYIKHLTGFFEKVVQDKTLNPTHISLYIALFQFWNFNRFRNPISITRDEIMRISKIASKATYHKCLKNLHALGYLNYQPSYNPFKGSQVYMFDFSEHLKPKPRQTTPKTNTFSEPLDEQALNNNQTSAEQALVPSINSINDTNQPNPLNMDEHPQKEATDHPSLENHTTPAIKEKKLRQKKKEPSTPCPIPTLTEILTYFDEQQYPEIEAHKFFNYFSSNGWLVGGKTKMKNWQASARNWILNAEKYKQPTTENRAKNLNTTTNKNYSEPL